MRYLVFGAVWVVCMVLSFLLVGKSSTGNIERLNKQGDLDPIATHQLHYENNLQLFVITVLLAGIFAVLVASMLVE